MKKGTKKPNPVFDALDAIDFKNYKFFEAADVSPYVLMLWCRGINDGTRDYRSLLLNLNVNTFVFHLQRHPQLLYKLLCTTGGFGKTFYRFIKRDSDKAIKMVAEYFQVSYGDAQDYIPLLSEDQLKDIEQHLNDKAIK